MASTLWPNLWAAAEQSTGALAEGDKDEILGLADSVVDSWQDKIVTAIVTNLPAGGIKNVEWGPIKNALLASEPQMEQATNDAVSKLFDLTVAKLQAAGK